MNRLQKKCVIATAGFHLLLLVILFVGPAFFWAREKADDTPVLEMIPANLVDSATTGVQGAQPPPAPAPTPLKPLATPAPVPKPVVQPAPDATAFTVDQIGKIFQTGNGKADAQNNGK